MAGRPAAKVNISHSFTRMQGLPAGGPAFGKPLRLTRRNPLSLAELSTECAYVSAGGDRDRMTANHESYLLMASTQNDMEDWVKSIRRVIWGPFGGGEQHVAIEKQKVDVATFPPAGRGSAPVSKWVTVHVNSKLFSTIGDAYLNNSWRLNSDHLSLEYVEF